MLLFSGLARCPLVAMWLLANVGIQAELMVPRFELNGAFPVELPGDQRIDTGFLVVRENRSRLDGRVIRLPVAILRSGNAQPALDPVLYLPGGPGGSALNTARYGFAYPFLKHRDFVIIEPRGARFSEPSLVCQEVPAARIQDATRPSGSTATAELRTARKCREQIAAKGIDPSAYTTEASAADLKDLRRVLGYSQWNLYGVSYGTRLGLTILRDFPNTVRSAVLDSVLPPTVRYDEESRNNQDRSFDTLFRDCEALPRCREAYPNLRLRWRETVREAARKPLRVTVAVDKDAPPREVILNDQSISNAIPLNDTGSLAQLPQLLDGVADREGDALARIARWALRPSSYAWGLRYSVWCAEELPFLRMQEAKKKHLVVSPSVCAAWNVLRAPRTVNRSVVTDVPVLLLAGEYDPDTPPAWAAEAAKTLSQGQIIVFRGMGHAPSQEWSMPCAMSVADSFLRNPGESIDQSCAKALAAPAFKIRAKGDGT